MIEVPKLNKWIKLNQSKLKTWTSKHGINFINELKL